MDTELNCFPHIWTSVEITDWFGSEYTVRIYYLFVVIPQEDRRKDVHLLNYHLEFAHVCKNINMFQRNRISNIV